MKYFELTSIFNSMGNILVSHNKSHRLIREDKSYRIGSFEQQKENIKMYFGTAISKVKNESK